MADPGAPPASSREATPEVSGNSASVSLEQQGIPAQHRVLAGMVVRDRENAFTIKIHPECAVHQGQGGDASCQGFLQTLRAHPRGWWLSPAQMLVSAVSCFSMLKASLDRDATNQAL